MWRNFSTWQSVIWKIFSTWQIFSPQPPVVMRVTNIRYGHIWNTVLNSKTACRSWSKKSLANSFGNKTNNFSLYSNISFPSVSAFSIFLLTFHTHLTIMGRWQNNGLAICSPLIHIQVICSHNVNCTRPPPPPACCASSLTLGKAIRSFTHLRLYEMKHYSSTLMCCYLVFEAWSPQKTQWSQQRLQCWEFVTLDIVMLGV